MIFLNPASLLLLLLAGPIIIFYFLHRQPRPYKVSALFLWQAAQARPKSALYFLRTPLGLLLLQLLLLLLLSFGLANPVFYLTGAAAFQQVAIIIDGSASMQAISSGKTRYEEAVEQALALVRQAAAEQITVLQAQKRSKILSPLTKDKAAIIAKLKGSLPTFQGGPELSELIQLIKSQGELADFDRIFYLTDHRPQDEILKDLPVETILIAGAARNVGITSFAVRPNPERSLGYSVLVTVENFSEAKVATSLKVTADEETILETDIALEPYSRSSFSFPYRGLGRTRFVASLDVQDDLDYDNRRYFALLPAKKDLLWIGERNRFLEAAIAATGPFAFHYAQGGLRDAAELPAFQPDYSVYDLIIVNDTQLTFPIKGNILLVNSSYPPLVEVEENGEREALGEKAATSDELLGRQTFLQQALSVLRSHPILKNIEISDLKVSKIFGVKVAPKSEVIISSGGHPLLTLFEGDGLRLIFLGISLQASNLVLTVDFPILVRNMLSWLLPLVEAQGELEVGESISLDGLSPEIAIRDPEGKIHRLEGQLAFEETDLPGLYQVAAGDDLYYFAVNPPAAESQPSLATEVEGASGTSQASLLPQTPPKAAQKAKALWPYFSLGGLLVLLLELYYYERSL